MSVNICIKQTVSVRFAESDRWKRPRQAARGYDALVLFTEGEIEYIFEENSVTAKAGDLLLLPGNLPYYGIRHTDRVAFYVLDFQCTDSNEVEKFGAPCILLQNTPHEVVMQFSKLTELWERQSIERDLRVKAFLYTMLCHAFEDAQLTKTVTSCAEITEYIISRLGDEELTVSHLCERFFISESQLRRNIVKATGLRPNEYILTLRLNRAKNELLDTQKPAKQIAAACGFSNPYYFSRCFAKEFGLPPREFRKKYRY